MAEASHAVFLSYASQDADAAQRICEALRRAGIEVFIDQRELRGGDAWDQKIRREIHDCVLFIPIVSRHTQERLEGYFRHEWKLAIERTHHMAEQKAFLVPVVVDATEDKQALVPDGFRDVQWTCLPAGETPPEFVTRIQKLLSGESGPLPMMTGRPAAGTSRRSSLLLPAVLAVGLAAAAYLLLEKPWTAKSLAFAPPPHSVAVLPFVNMSGDKEQEYFADGLAEELLDLLAKTPGLHVIARTSSFSFRGKPEDIPAIAAKLRVANVLEGSVRKSGSHVRITTQLVRAVDGDHLWSETYDREMKDIFTVQDEIAAAVVEALKVRLLPAQRVVNQHRTQSLDAYTAYLLGNQLSASDSTESNRQALAAYRRAVALDPGYAAAYSGLAVSEWRVADQTTAENAAYRRAAAAADKAIALAPTLPAGYWARGTLRYVYSFDWDGARADFDKALALDANDVRTLVIYGHLQATLARLPEAIALTQRAIALDPLSVEAWDYLGFYLICGGQLAAARDPVARFKGITEKPTPTYIGSDYLLELLTGNAQAALQRAHYSLDEGDALFATALSQHSLGHAAESQAALDALITTRADTWAYQIAEVYSWRGEGNSAIEWLERAYRQRDGGITRLAIDPLLKSLHDDRRFKALLRRLNLPE